MKAYIVPPANLSRAMDRVAGALQYHRPSHVSLTRHAAEADLVVFHTVHTAEHAEREQFEFDLVRSRGQKYAILQYCLRTTVKPHTFDWLPLWRGAELVYSYYDLNAALAEDGSKETLDNFLHLPLGVAPGFRRGQDEERPFDLATSGYVAETESIFECLAAVKNIDGRMFHLGPGHTAFGPEVYQALGIEDGALSAFYNRCKFVAGLRRVEGFELPAAEGLICGARPIVFDAPHYRRWYEGFAEFVPEGDFATVVAALTKLLQAGPRPVSDDEIAQARALFSWKHLASSFWERVAPTPHVTVRDKPRLLWVGDAGVATGFAKSTHEICDRLQADYDVAVLGLNYVGDPHKYTYPIFPTVSDFFGLRRLPDLASKCNLLVIQNDPWNIPPYIEALKQAKVQVPTVGVIAVDARNCSGTSLNELTHCIFWTRFAEAEARKGGYRGTSTVIGLGVDTDVFKPVDQLEARRELRLPESLWDKFIVTIINRNQPRKRLDLLVSYFADWVNKLEIEDAYLYAHVSPTQDHGWDLRQLMQYYGFRGDRKRLIASQPDAGYGVPEREIVLTHAAGDIGATTAVGEGWGLSTLEGMACRRAQLGGDFAALGEWASGSAVLVPCTEIFVHTGGINTIGMIPDRGAFIEGLHKLYRDRHFREEYASRGFKLAQQKQFNWDTIGAAVGRELAFVLHGVLDGDRQEA